MPFTDDVFAHLRDNPGLYEPCTVAQNMNVSPRRAANALMYLTQTGRITRVHVVTPEYRRAYYGVVGRKRTR